jgi:hypothetical protein
LENRTVRTKMRKGFNAALINDPEHWRSRAEEARAIASDLKDPEPKRIMEDIAVGYDRLAQHAADRLLSGRTA